LICPIKAKLTPAGLRLWGLCGLLLNGCAEKLPPVPPGTPSFEPVLATLEYERPAWSPSGQHTALVQGEQTAGRYELVLVSLQDGSRRTLQSTVATNMPLNLFEGMRPNFDWSPDGHWIAYASQSVSHPRCICVVSRDGTENNPVTKPVEFVKGLFVHYPSTGGLQIPSFLFRPAGAGKSQRPAIDSRSEEGGQKAQSHQL
jgi:hypothetical protein